MTRAGDVRHARGRVVLLAACLVGVGALASACGSGESDAVTTLDGVTGVVVTAPGGLTHAGVQGERLLVGDSVTTTGAGSALLTGGRVTTLGTSSEVTIAARSRYVLDQGSLVVDRQKGVAAVVDAGPVSVDHLGRTSVRVERGFSVRVALYQGGGAHVEAGQRTVTVDALHELDVPGAALPTITSPLALRDDALDTAADADLVAVDAALNERSTGLDEPAAATVTSALLATVPHVVPAAEVSLTDSSRPLSERLLPIAIARAASKPASVETAYETAVDLRADGAAWAVVAALSDAGLTQIQAELSALLDGPAGVDLVTGSGTTGGPGVTGNGLTGVAGSTTGTDGSAGTATGSGDGLTTTTGGSTVIGILPGRGTTGTGTGAVTGTGGATGTGAGPGGTPVPTSSSSPVPTIPGVPLPSAPGVGPVVSSVAAGLGAVVGSAAAPVVSAVGGAVTGTVTTVTGTVGSAVGTVLGILGPPASTVAPLPPISIGLPIGR